MRPRTSLGIINGNRGVNNELTPNQRRKIEGAIAISASFARAVTLIHCDPETARKTILLAPKRHNRISIWTTLRMGRKIRKKVCTYRPYTPKDNVRRPPRSIIYLYILKKYYISKWLSK
jgi:hypothetical protein